MKCNKCIFEYNFSINSKESRFVNSGSNRIKPIVSLTREFKLVETEIEFFFFFSLPSSLFKRIPFTTASNTVYQNNEKRRDSVNVPFNSLTEKVENSRKRWITTRVDSFGVKKNQHEFARGARGHVNETPEKGGNR